ncbi:MAG: aminotransferase class V-fold PLP-dependent enzyme [Oscillospiraceae bacterium]|nr:aminotransferase class V-fold PLP-dependent enzyme [Oscillospiraceae bacterium]
MKYSFANDYSEGAHQSILNALCETNLVQTPGYGVDDFCERAKAAIRRAMKSETADIHFLVGGTQTNFTVISSLLRPHQCVISSDLGHINAHETGAVESTGHKIIAIPSVEGKITAEAIQAVLKEHAENPIAEHFPQPAMVYISQSTEMGTIYSKAEMHSIHKVCQDYGIPLFVDGARLGCGLTCRSSDITLPDMADLCDIFFIGGTKNGALFGEAVVFNDPKLGRDFRYMIKLRGGMLAKGRLLGLQFEQLFTDDLYFKLARHANEMAEYLAEGIAALGYKFDAAPVTNQIFPIFPKKLIAELEKDYSLTFISHVDDDHDCMRLCTSWASDKQKLAQFLDDLKKLS